MQTGVALKLYFMRHGKAAYIQGADAQRPLTEEGRRDVAAVVDSRIDSLINVGLILTSPYRRARETAEITIARINHWQAGRNEQGFQGELLICDELVPESNFTVLAKLLDELNSDSILLTSHQPLVGQVVSTLVDDPRLQAMEPAWLAAVETEAVLPGYGELNWLAVPGS